MSNVLDAVFNIISFDNYKIKSVYSGRNRVNGIGDALEVYVRDAFAGCIGESDEKIRMAAYEEVFSWIGVQNHPPDAIVRCGDAIEVKKTQSSNASLALNSSYPKAKLHANDPMLTEDCRLCEDWQTKDIIYCVGHTSDTHVKSLWMVYGDIYAAKKNTYEKVKNAIAGGVHTIPNVVFSPTTELGRVNKVDPLGITNLRVRGMWQIENPRKAFDYLYRSGSGNSFELVLLLPNSKYHLLPSRTRTRLSKIEKDISLSNHAALSVQDVKVKDPNNPAKLIDSKLILYIKT